MVADGIWAGSSPWHPSNLPLPTLTSKHAPSLQASRNLEASWKDMTCWRQEESGRAAWCYEQALRRGNTDSLGGPTAAPVPAPSACQASGYSGKHHDLAWVSLLQEAARCPQLDQSPIPGRTASGPASAAAPITAL